MPMLSASEQVVLRRYAEHALIGRCDIQRRTRTTDGAGGFTASYATVYSNVKCRISPVRNDFQQERVIAERLGASTSWILSLPVGTDIKLNDRVIIASSNPLEVQAIMDVPRSIETVIRTVVLEVK